IETSRVAERGRRLVGFVGAEIDESLDRVWFYGPVVDDPDWHVVADALLAALTTGVPGSTGKTAEVVGDVANARLAAFAERHGFGAGKVHHLLALPAPMIESLERPELAPIAVEHESAFVARHEELFPGTYYSGPQLLDQAARGKAVVLGVIDDGRLVGYAAGRVDEGGDGYLDFVGVAPD